MGITRGPWTTLDGLVAALTEQQGWAEVTTPSDISVDGYAGKAFQRTAPADISDCDTSFGRSRAGCRLADFRSWDNPTNSAGSYEPGEIETLWVLDLDGTVVVIQHDSVAGAIGGGSRRIRRRARLDPHRAAHEHRAHCCAIIVHRPAHVVIRGRPTRH